MASFNATTKGAAQNEASLTVPHEAAGDDRIVFLAVGTISNNTSTPTSVAATYDGNAATKVGSDGRSIGTNRYLNIDVFVYVGPPTGVKNAVANFSAPAALSSSMIVASYKNVDGYNATGSADGDSTGPSCNVTTAVANALLVGAAVAYDAGSQTLAPGSGITERDEQAAAGGFASDDHRIALMDKFVAAAGSTAFNATAGSSAVWAIAAVELQPVVGSGLAVKAAHFARMRG